MGGQRLRAVLRRAAAARRPVRRSPRHPPWASLGGLGFAAGVLIGGVLTAGPGWRWVFFINVPVGVVLLVAIRALVPPRRPDRAAARRVARSKARRALRPGVECPICGAWFCSVVPVGQDYRQRRFCSDACRLEAASRARQRRWMRRALATLGLPAPEME